MPYATPEEALKARLAADSAVNTAVGGRITPQLNTQEPTLPLVLYRRIAGARGATLAGASNRLGEYVLQVDVYAETETAAAAIGVQVRDALFPGGGWVDRTNGVYGCFPDDSAQDATEDPWRLWSTTVRIWFKG